MLEFLFGSNRGNGGLYTLVGQQKSFTSMRSTRTFCMIAAFIVLGLLFVIPHHFAYSQTHSLTVAELTNPASQAPVVAERPKDIPSQTQQTPAAIEAPKYPTISQTSTVASTTSSTLITYVYSENQENRENFVFFLQHGLHKKVDFIFIFNGNASAATLLPQLPNIKIVERNNSCYDLGAHAEVLTKDNLYKQYSKFILMNASVRGPFLPHWAEACWSDRFTNKVTDTVKVRFPHNLTRRLSPGDTHHIDPDQLVGMTLNCWPTPHVQSMVWATDYKGLDLLLFPPPNGPSHEWMSQINPGETIGFSADQEKHESDAVDRGLNKCFDNRLSAVEAEIGATGIIIAAGFKVDVMLTRFQIDRDYIGHCKDLGSLDVQGEGAYDGISYHPFETLFIKTNRGINPKMIELYSNWSDRANISSYDYC